MTVVHVHGTHVASRMEGISANVHGLCGALRRAGLDVALASAPADLDGLNRRRALARGAWRAARAAREASRSPATSLVHLHVSLPSLAVSARWARRRGGPPVLVHAWNAHAEPGAPRAVPAADRLAHRLLNGPEAAALALAGQPDVVVASRHQARQLRALGFRGRVHRVPNGVDLDRFRPASAAEAERARAALGVDGDPVLLYYGHASAWKGVGVLAAALPRALRRHPQAQALLSLTSYGRGGAALREALRRAGVEDRVRFLGPGDVPTLHAASDLAVLPAVAGVGTACYPNVLLECMAGGVPVLATRAGCVPEVVQDGRTGLLARPAHAADLAARLDELMGDPVLRRRLAAQARRLAAEKYGWDTVARRMLLVYASLGVPVPAATQGAVAVEAGRP